jgi:signal peptidase I
MSKKGKAKRVFKYITDVISWTCLCILILIGALLVWYFISAKIYASKGEKYTPYFSLYTIISPSMEPNIKVYDVILDTRVDDVNTIKEGDIITFISSGNLSSGMTITHRVVEVLHTDEGLRFRTKGDNNQTADGALVIPENVLGKTLLRIPMLGRVQFLLASKGGLLIFILIPAVGIIVYDIIKLFRVKDVSDKVEEVIQDKPEDKVPEEQKMIEENRKQELIEKLNKEKNKKKIEFEFVPIEEKNIETNKHQEENNNIVFDDDEIEQEITDIDFEDDEDDF